MSTPSQHPAPDLDQLRLLARRLLTAYDDRQVEAVTRVRAHLRRFAEQGEPTGGRAFGLQEAQFIIAREHGFASWTELKHHTATSEAALLASFMDATSAGDSKRVLESLNARPSLVNALSDGQQRTPLRIAADGGHAEVVKLLLERGADPNLPSKDGEPPLTDAAESGHLDVVNLLLEHGADPNIGGNSGDVGLVGWGSLYQATLNDPDRVRDTRGKMLTALMAHGGRPSIYSAIFQGDRDAVRHMATTDPHIVHRQMARHNNHWTPLHFAVANHRPEMVELLIDQGADREAVDTDRLTPLDVAALAGAEECVRILLDRGAHVGLPAAVALGRDADIERELRLHPDSLTPGKTWGHLLATAASCGAVDTMDRLLAMGASINDPHDGATPLHLAAVKGHVHAIETLLAHGADVTSRDSAYASTPLGWARWGSQRGTEKLLLEHGVKE